MSLDKVERQIANALDGVHVDQEAADLALAEISEFLNGGQKGVSDALATQKAALSNSNSRLDKLADMWMADMITDRSRYVELERRETESLNDLSAGVEMARSELERMRQNARRARDFAAFSRGAFACALPERKRALARALGIRDEFYGRKKLIEIVADPLVEQFVSLAKQKKASLEPQKEGSQKQASRKETLVFGGRAGNVLEPVPEGDGCVKRAELPASLVEALKGPLFADLWAGVYGAA